MYLYLFTAVILVLTKIHHKKREYVRYENAIKIVRWGFESITFLITIYSYTHRGAREKEQH